MNRKCGIEYALEFADIKRLDSDEINFEIYGKFSQRTLEQLKLEKQNIDNDESVYRIIEGNKLTLENLKYILDILKANKESYYIVDWKLHIGCAFKENLVILDDIMRGMKQEYALFRIKNDEEEKIIDYTKDDMVFEEKIKPLAIYMDEYMNKEEKNILIQINNIKPHVVLYLSNMISTLNSNNNIENSDYIAILKERSHFYDVWDFLINSNVKYIFKWEISSDEITESILNQIETFLQNFNVRYYIIKRFDNIKLNVYLKNRETLAFIVDVLELNDIVYVEESTYSDIDLSGTSLWMFSTSKDEKEKICEMLQMPDQKRIDRLKELGAPQIIIDNEVLCPTKCTYGVFSSKKLQKQIENILQSLKLEYVVLNRNREIIKRHENLDAINRN